ncbi:hypothetical protein DV738_g820, partial [Chaetothyriales sp. CBS 135597]
MAQHGHSPPLATFGAPGSPPRALDGIATHPRYTDAHAPYPMYGPQPRPMPPPSPHAFAAPPRYVPAPLPQQHNEIRAPAPAHKSSGKATDSLFSRPSHSSIGASMPLAAATANSPPYAPRPAPAGYRLGTRSATPDKLGDHLAARPYRSNSGSLLQRPGPFHTQSNGTEHQSHSFLQNGSSGTASSNMYTHNDDAAERARRTSLGAILHRPDSEPTMPTSSTPLLPHLSSIPRPETASATTAPPPPLPQLTPSAAPKAVPSGERAARTAGSYDTRPPPAISSTARPLASPTVQSRDSSSRSPELRRSILNGPPGLAIGPERMQRQDSAQSQSSLLGDRHKSRQFSPFASSVASLAMSTGSAAPSDGQARKGSDELSQHRAVLGLAQGSRRGRYSPVPQAVKGAQAQTPVPDAGIKSEHGRVFAGLGGGLGSSASSAPPTSTPVGLSASPFKLSEENLIKLSPGSSAAGKRARKYDQDIGPESEVAEVKRGGRKKTKYGHSYKVDLEGEPARKGTPLAGLNGFRRAGTPAGANSQNSLQRHGPSDPVPPFRPSKTIRVASIIAAAKRFPRRHLGNFIYNPEVSKADCLKPGFDKFDVSIKPNLLPSFAEADQVNCTYTVRVSRIWLQTRERSLICKQAYLWGSGVYTDDSDVVAAAMHSGYISSQPPDNVDKVLLERVTKTQNAQIEGLVDLPDRPVEPPAGTDAVITLLVLPALERYPASSRFGLSSREWPGSDAKAPHDGVSFAILKVDFVTGGIEGRRMGRTGKEKRRRMEQEQQDRLQSQPLLKLMLEQARRKLKEQGKPLSKKPHPLSVAHNASTLIEQDSTLNSTTTTTTAANASADELQKAKDKAKADGGDIKHEFTLIKGFTVEFPDDKVGVLQSNDHVHVEEDREIKTQ